MQQHEHDWREQESWPPDLSVRQQCRCGTYRCRKLCPQKLCCDLADHHEGECIFSYETIEA